MAKATRKAQAVTAEIIELGGQVPTNGGEEPIMKGAPYIAHVKLIGVADYLYHGWNVEAVQLKADAAKGSTAKKTDNLESYVYRDEDKNLAIPGEQLRMSLVNAARSIQDPRSPRKSAMDLFRASVVVLNRFSSIGRKKWDYINQARVSVQRQAVTRSRPALHAGWTGSWDIQILSPEYITPEMLNETLSRAGRFCGLGDWRPSYGRFQIAEFKVDSAI